MANDALMIAGLGALLFLGLGKTKEPDKETDEDVAAAGVASDGTSVIAGKNGTSVITVIDNNGTSAILAPVDMVRIGGVGGEVVTVTELEVRRSEQIEKQNFVASVTHKPRATRLPVKATIHSSGATGPVPGAGGAPRPTPTARPKWNNNVGWYWYNPKTGRAVRADGREWSPSDTTVHMGAVGVNIGRTLPPGWVKNRGGTADLFDPTGTLAQDIGF